MGRRGNRIREAITDVYQYRRLDGAPAFATVRRDIAPGRGRKVLQASKDDEGEWRQLRGSTPRVLFRGERLVGLAIGTVIWIAEGEKDVLNVEALGLVAVTNAFGSHVSIELWGIPEVIALFVGHHVVLLRDKDAAGSLRVARLIELLKPVAASLRVLESAVGDEGSGADVSDHLTAGWPLDAMLERELGDFPAPEPPRALIAGDSSLRVTSAPVTEAGRERARAYVRQPMDQELAKIIAAPPQTGNPALYAAAVKLFRLVPLGVVSEAQIAERVTAAARQRGGGHSTQSVRDSIRSAAGMAGRTPRTFPDFDAIAALEPRDPAVQKNAALAELRLAGLGISGSLGLELIFALLKLTIQRGWPGPFEFGHRGLAAKLGCARESLEAHLRSTRQAGLISVVAGKRAIDAEQLRLELDVILGLNDEDLIAALGARAGVVSGNRPALVSINRLPPHPGFGSRCLSPVRRHLLRLATDLTTQDLAALTGRRQRVVEADLQEMSALGLVVRDTEWGGWRLAPDWAWSLDEAASATGASERSLRQSAEYARQRAEYRGYLAWKQARQEQAAAEQAALPPNRFVVQEVLSWAAYRRELSAALAEE
ncbi:MAG: toprim domain-containing protein [Acidimicrobiales bacterium]|nr:toprim domain-containing protein [Acidimicrobiales bacterium]